MNEKEIKQIKELRLNKAYLLQVDTNNTKVIEAIYSRIKRCFDDIKEKPRIILVSNSFAIKEIESTCDICKHGFKKAD